MQRFWNIIKNVVNYLIILYTSLICPAILTFIFNWLLPLSFILTNQFQDYFFILNLPKRGTAAVIYLCTLSTAAKGFPIRRSKYRIKLLLNMRLILSLLSPSTDRHSEDSDISQDEIGKAINVNTPEIFKIHENKTIKRTTC